MITNIHQLKRACHLSIILMLFSFVLSRVALEIFAGTSVLIFVTYLAQERNTKLLMPNSLVKFTWFFWLSVIFMTLVNVDGRLLSAIVWGRYILLMLAISWVYTNNKAYLQQLWSVVLLIAVFLLVDSWWQYVWGLDILGKPILYAGVSDSARLTGPFTYPRVGSALAIFAVLAWSYLVNTTWLKNKITKARQHKILLTIVLSAIIVVVTIFISNERRAFMAILATAGFIILAWPGRKLLFMSSGCLMLALILLLGWQFAPGNFYRQVTKFNDYYQNFWHTEYGEVWYGAINLGQERPLSGVGIKNFSNYNPYFEASDGMRAAHHAHNYYLQFFSEQGYPGLVLFSLWVLSVLVFLNRNWHRLDFTLKCAAIIVVVQLIPIAPNPSFYTAWGAVPLWLLLGLLMALSHSKEQQREE
ncbi:MAG: O-antigen ligase family protein [Pseudomonadota bacterium]